MANRLFLKEEKLKFTDGLLGFLKKVNICFSICENSTLTGVKEGMKIRGKIFDVKGTKFSLRLLTKNE